MDNTISKESLMSSLRAMSVEASGQSLVKPAPESSGEQFAPLLKEAVKAVSDRQLNASGMAVKFEHGDSSVSLSDVMVEMQKARISFEALTQVRNKFVGAYQQIMSMPL